MVAVFSFDEMLRVIDEEDTVEVIYLMLERLRENAACAAREGIAVSVICLHGCALMTLRAAIDTADREAAFVHLFFTARYTDKFRVYENANGRWGNRRTFFRGRKHTVFARNKYPFTDPYLGCCERNAVRLRIKCERHILKELRERSAAELSFGDRFRDIAQHLRPFLDYIHAVTIARNCPRARAGKEKRRIEIVFDPPQGEG